MGRTVCGTKMAGIHLKFYFYFALATLGLCEACTDGVLLVGGRNQDGPQQDVKLLRDSGWCDSSGFPNITEPLDNPGVYYMNGVLLVCGFSTGSPCKYTSQGWDSWSDVHTDFLEDVGYQMVYSSKVGSVMSASKRSSIENHIQHNPVVINPLTNTLIPWMEVSGSPFSILTGGSGGITNSYLDISNSCLGSYNGDLVLSGGFSYHYCTRCTYGTSERNVVFWSVSGNSANNGPPAFEQGVIPGLTDSREAHSCVEFEGMFLVLGGYGHTYSQGPNGGDPQESLSYQSSGEYYDGVSWHQAESLTTARAHFSLEEMCGSLVSIGGQAGQEEYLSTVERLWTVWNSWIPADYLSLPQPLAHAGSAAVSNLECWQ